MAGRALHIDTPEAAEAWISARFGEWAQSLTDIERLAIDHYKGSGFKAINRLARDTELDLHTAEELADAKAHAVELDRALARFRLPESVVVYRGIADANFADDTDLLVPGAEISDDGYLSTSLVRKIAEGFLSPHDDENRLLRITLPGGLHAIHAGAPDLIIPMFEAEILLPAGTRFRVTKAPAPTGYVIDLEAIA